MREIQFGDGPAKYYYAAEADEKIADLEAQVESLCVALKLSQCRVKDLEKRVEKLEAVRVAAEKASPVIATVLSSLDEVVIEPRKEGDEGCAWIMKEAMKLYYQPLAELQQTLQEMEGG